ncbi:hypothetical protein [Kineococcus indalonis]|uniref:hypothetical protein n=1 Tax=Kineococcus indalonis TaxID=2696566 RepID=UPI001412A9FB|nr:hypothetical protein [Kineococcus indalonis]NAZ86990.1 hypothetical protein [Kineococcus indalonis]
MSGTVHELEAQQTPDDAGDAVLELLSTMADRGTVVAITLFSGGQVVSGTLVGRDRWLQEFVGRAARGGGGGRQIAEQVQGLFRAADLRRPGDGRAPRDYLHLLDAQIDGLPRIAEGLLWRGRISEVAGWSLGSL